MSGQDRNLYENSDLEGDFFGTSVAADMFGSSDLDSETPLRLKNWSAQDFSNIYVRFRPHLENHARKFLSNHSFVEEVVQDAFLYLMTALPDLDSEVGVLRFLKWKTRLLCLDVIRAESGNPIRNAEPLDESAASSERDLSESIERADDAAIVRLALAQLSPRHREAIVATVFEEKSSQQVAMEMGLSENAFRQLLLRARRSFKAVFVGEAEAANMSVSEALKLAAKRKQLKLISGTSLVLFLFAAFVVSPNISPTSQVAASPVASPIQEISPPPGFSRDGQSRGPENAEQEAAGTDKSFAEGQNLDPIAFTEPGRPRVILDISEDQELSFPVSSDEDDEKRSFEGELALVIASNPLRLDSSGAPTQISEADEMVIRHSMGFNLTLVIHLSSCEADANSKPCKLYIEDARDGNNLIWLAQTLASEELTDQRADILTVDVVATDFLVGDFGGTFGNVAVDAPVQGALEYLRFKLEFVGSDIGIKSMELLKRGV